MRQRPPEPRRASRQRRRLGRVLRSLTLGALAACFSPLRAAVPSPGDTGYLPGTPGETPETYPYEGTRSGGHAGIHTYIQMGNAGSFTEPQLDDSLPNELIPQDFRWWTGRDGARLLDLEWELPTEEDGRFRGLYRDMRNFDLEYRRFDSRWFDRPDDRPSTWHSDRASLRVRKWSGLHLEASYEDTRVRRNAPERDRDSGWIAAEAGAIAWLGDVRADLGFSTREYNDLEEPTDAFRDEHLELRLSRDISPDTNLRVFLATDERTLLATEEVQRDLTLSADTRTYDLFRLRGLKFRTEARYVTRPSSFQRTQDEEESMRLGARFAWDLGGGVIEAGARQVRREVQRLTRQGVLTLLQDPATPLATLQGLRDQLFPNSRRKWVKGTIPLLPRARLFARLDETAVDGPPRTNWATGNASPLYYTNQRGSLVSLSLFPFEGVDLRGERKLQQRFLAGRGDHFAGQDQRLESTFVHLHLGFLPRIDVDLQFSDNDTHHVDDVVGKESVTEVTDQAVDVAYALNQSVSLESSYQRLNHDGGSGATQEVVQYAIDYGGTGHRAEVRLEYTLDDFDDPEEGTSSYRAKVVSLSGRVHF